YNYLYSVNGSTGAVVFAEVNIGASTQAYNKDVKLDNICLVDSDGNGTKDRIAVGCSDGFVRRYTFAGVEQAGEKSPAIGSAVTSVEGRNLDGDNNEETIAGTKTSGIMLLDHGGSVSLGTKAMNFVFKITNQGFTNKFAVAAKDNQYVLKNDGTEEFSKAMANYGYASAIITGTLQTLYLAHINWDKNIYYDALGVGPGIPYVEIPSSNSITGYVTSSSAVRMGQCIAYLAFDLKLNSNGSAVTSARWKRLRIDKYVPLNAAGAPNSKIEIQIWKEANGNKRWDIGDALVTTGSFGIDNTAWLNMKRYILTTNPSTFYVVCKLADTIGGGQTFGVRILNSAYLEFEDDVSVSNTNF
ncbi:hypothetical protein HY772_04590, partial [Candidatus Woesearchaeota archaeon]|nr:hypothetical protein [Candidatus Woesearchaeota archaeon]